MADNAIQHELNHESRLAAPLSDSPWFWAALFAAMALVALVAMNGKYGRRQANIEQKFQARERVRWDVEAGSGQPAEGGQEFSRPGDTVIPLWPLTVPLAVVIVVSIAMLVRRHQLNRRGAENAEKG